MKAWVLIGPWGFTTVIAVRGVAKRCTLLLNVRKLAPLWSVPGGWELLLDVVDVVAGIDGRNDLNIPIPHSFTKIVATNGACRHAADIVHGRPLARV